MAGCNEPLKKKTNTRELCKAFHRWWETPEFPLRCLRILVPEPRRCLPRAKKCSPGFQMPTILTEFSSHVHTCSLLPQRTLLAQGAVKLFTFSVS